MIIMSRKVWLFSFILSIDCFILSLLRWRHEKRKDQEWKLFPFPLQVWDEWQSMIKKRNQSNNKKQMTMTIHSLFMSWWGRCNDIVLMIIKQTDWNRKNGIKAFDSSVSWQSSSLVLSDDDDGYVDDAVNTLTLNTRHSCSIPIISCKRNTHGFLESI